MKLSKKHIKNIIFEFIIINVGAAIAAAAIFFFMIPSHVVVGSGSALAMVLGNFIDIPISAIMFIINAVLLTLGFLLIGPEFGIKTVYSAIMVPAYMGLFELLLPDFQSLTNDPLLDMIGYILVVGIGSAILFSRNASSGGLAKANSSLI